MINLFKNEGKSKNLNPQQVLDIVNQWIDQYLNDAVAQKVFQKTTDWEKKLNAVFRAINTNDVAEIQEDEFGQAFDDSTMAATFWEMFKNDSGTSLDQLKMSLFFKKMIEAEKMSDVTAMNTVDIFAKKYLNAKILQAL